MSDRLKDFVNKHREAFDDKEPPESVWSNISNALPQRNTTHWYNHVVFWRAAALLFMALSFYLLIPKSSPVNEAGSLAVKEFNDVEAFYTTQISQKVALIEELSDSASVDEFTQDFQQLEAMYLVLKEEWKTHPSKKVKDALVLNLLVRINLLNQQLHRIEEEFEKDAPLDKSI